MNNKTKGELINGAEANGNGGKKCDKNCKYFLRILVNFFFFCKKLFFNVLMIAVIIKKYNNQIQTKAKLYT